MGSRGQSSEKGKSSGTASGGRYARSLKDAEDRIRNNPVESAIIVDRNGNVVLDKSDDAVDSVMFTTADTEKMANRTMTHNHPSGTTFSKEDIQCAFSYGLKEMRACHKDGCYSLRRNFKLGEEIPDKYYDFARDYYRAYMGYKAKTVDSIWEQTRDAVRCNDMVAQYRRKWLKANAADYGWRYSEE